MLEQVADGFAKVDNQAERVRLAFQLFDIEGVAMVNMLHGGSGALQGLRKEARTLGNVMSKNTTDAAANFGDAINRLHHVVAGLKNGLMHQLLPAFT